MDGTRGELTTHLKVLLDSGGAYKPHLVVNLLIRLTTIEHFKY